MIYYCYFIDWFIWSNYLICWPITPYYWEEVIIVRLKNSPRGPQNLWCFFKKKQLRPYTCMLCICFAFLLFLICLWAFFIAIISILIYRLTGKFFKKNLSLQLCCENMVSASVLPRLLTIYQNVHQRVLF